MNSDSETGLGYTYKKTNKSSRLRWGCTVIGIFSLVMVMFLVFAVGYLFGESNYAYNSIMNKLASTPVAAQNGDHQQPEIHYPWVSSPQSSQSNAKSIFAAGKAGENGQGKFVRKSKGKGKKNGIFKETDKLDKSPQSHGKPNTIDELKKEVSIGQIAKDDEVYEYIPSDDILKTLFDNWDKKGNGGAPKGNRFNDEQRRLVIIGSNEQHRITTKTLADECRGLIEFKANGQSAHCSGTKISKKHILTAGHCCHQGWGGFGTGWFTEFKWYKGARTYAERDSSTGITLAYPVTFQDWATNGVYGKYDFDMCLLTMVGYSDPYYFGFGYDDNLPLSTAFYYEGYPSQLMDNTGIKWGEDLCYPKTIQSQLIKYTCDTAGGQSGMGMVKKGTYNVYCVHSHGSTVENGCCKFTQSKFDAFYNYIVQYGGYA